MSSRVFEGHLGSWPEVYRQPNGNYHVHAWHHGPHTVIGGIVVLAGWLGLAFGVKWVWDQTIIGGVAAAVPALFCAFMLVLLPMTRLYLTVRLDGDVLRSYSRNQAGRYIFSSEEAYRFQPQLHSAAEQEARANERVLHRRRQAWALEAHEIQQRNGTRRKQEPPPPEPAAPMTFFAGSSELFVIRGAGEWKQIAEFGFDPQARKAAQLAGALEYIFYQAKQDAAQAQRAALTLTIADRQLDPASSSTPAPLPMDEEYE